MPRICGALIRIVAAGGAHGIDRRSERGGATHDGGGDGNRLAGRRGSCGRGPGDGWHARRHGWDGRHGDVKLNNPSSKFD